MTQYDREDQLLRAALRELRAADERDAPSFEAVLARSSARSAHLASYGPRLAIAAGLVLAAGVVYRSIVARNARFTVPNEVVALSAWRPQTDVLLETTGRNLLRQAPQLGASFIDTVTRGNLP